MILDLILAGYSFVYLNNKLGLAACFAQKRARVSSV